MLLPPEQTRPHDFGKCPSIVLPSFRPSSNTAPLLHETARASSPAQKLRQLRNTRRNAPRPKEARAGQCHFGLYVRRSPRASATVLLTGILPDSMALTLARSILRRLAQAA